MSKKLTNLNKRDKDIRQKVDKLGENLSNISQVLANLGMEEEQPLRNSQGYMSIQPHKKSKDQLKSIIENLSLSTPSTMITSTIRGENKLTDVNLCGRDNSSRNQRLFQENTQGDESQIITLNERTQEKYLTPTQSGSDLKFLRDERAKRKLTEGLDNDTSFHHKNCMCLGCAPEVYAQSNQLASLSNDENDPIHELIGNSETDSTS